MVKRIKKTFNKFGKPTNQDRKKSINLEPSVISTINNLISKISSRVITLPPDLLLHRAWWNLVMMKITLNGKEIEQDEQLTAQRMIDYIQSVIASIPPAKAYKKVVSDEDWKHLFKDVNDLFKLINNEYLIHQYNAGAKNTHSIEEFKIITETLWMNVRGKRYDHFEIIALEELLEPHSDVLERNFKIDSSSLVCELAKAFQGFKIGPLEKITNIFDDLFNTTSFMREVPGINDDVAPMCNELLNAYNDLDYFDLKKTTNIPEKLLNSLSWSPGEEKDFFAPGEFCGWPRRSWPIFKRPFIRINNRILCFDKYTLFDNLYRTLRKIIIEHEPQYQEKWNKRQDKCIAELIIKYFTKLLPNVIIHRSVYYMDIDEIRAETDLLLIYDDHLFVIEIKGGLFTNKSPLDERAFNQSINNLTIEGAKQGSRFFRSLKQKNRLALFDKRNNEIGYLSYSNFRVVSLCVITLEHITDISSRLHHLPIIKDKDVETVWYFSIDDLRIFADLFDNPLIFLHYAEHRLKAAKSIIVELFDEMEHLGLYFLNPGHIINPSDTLNINEKTKLLGNKLLIDDYYRLINHEFIKKPTVRVCENDFRILNLLAKSIETGRVRIASLILDLAITSPENLKSNKKNLKFIKENNYITFLLDNSKVTIFPIKSDEPRNTAGIISILQADLFLSGMNKGILIEIEYSREMKVIGIDWQNIYMNELTEREKAIINTNAKRLRDLRISYALKKEKIKVNDLCPCFSGRKYKKCCGLKVS
jgi:hypothetical protein